MNIGSENSAGATPKAGEGGETLGGDRPWRLWVIWPRLGDHGVHGVQMLRPGLCPDATTLSFWH